ncbi:MAG: 6-phosphogluconolactonase [Gaiellaceae bacterium]
MTVELVVAGDAERAAAAVARRLVDAADAGEAIALAGGTTPRRAYELAAGQRADWSRASVWWGDERCVAPDDPRSNFRLAREALLDRLSRPPAAVHRIEGELGADAAAAGYDEAIRGVRLGFVLLGIGADGHTASLFPGGLALAERERLAVAVPAAGVDRVTLTPPALSSADIVCFLAVGADKAEAVALAFSGPPTTDVPASLIRSAAGRTVAILDRSAAGRLDKVARGS